MPTKKSKAAKCYILAGDVMTTKRFPVSRSGWTAARDEVLYAQQSGAGYATLMCPVGDRVEGIPMYQCYKGRGCTIEGYEGDTVIAGSRRSQRPKRRR
jgi:hypothetical protein